MMFRDRVRATSEAIGFYILFQIAVSATGLFWSGELAGLSPTERLAWFGNWIISFGCYANPFAFFFLYLASIKWLLSKRQFKIGLATSAAFYSGFGFYYGALFMNGLNGQLHGKFDQALGINPGPLVSAVFPLSMAFVLPALATLVIGACARRLSLAS
jgi:hypothetical protein